MILNIAIENFGPIKGRQVLSFEADKSTHLEDAYVAEINGQRILKMALIYGANASGKTTVLKAIEFLRRLVLFPENKKTDTLNYKPFLFDPYTPAQTSSIGIEFYQNGIRYLYEVEFTKEAIVSEELYYHNPNKASVFKRDTNLETQFAEIKFGSKFNIDSTTKKTLAANTLWNNTVLGGYLKTNIELKELQEVTDWFNNNLAPTVFSQTNLENFITQGIDERSISKADVLSILKKADFNISDIIIEEKEEVVFERLLNLIKRDTSFSDEAKKKVEQERVVSVVNLELEHEVNDVKYSLPFEEESQGTKRYYGFAGMLALLLSSPSVMPIDELESSLHPDLYLHFMLSFLLNAKNSQIIATTHNREILNNKDIFRDDAIWFTDKSESSATRLYSLADFGSTITRANTLNAYKSGILSAIPNLGDIYIDLKP